MSARQVDIQRERQLVEAAANGNLSTLVALLKSGVSVEAVEYNKTLFFCSKNYMTPLQVAASNGHAHCVEALIAHNADVNALDRFDATAVHVAAENGHYNCLRALLMANAEVSLPTRYAKQGTSYSAIPYLGGTTPLHLAAQNNHTECVQELIQYGADYNATDELGRTSLYIAAMFGFKECVLTHLEHAVGRDILSLPSTDTLDTPLHFAVIKGMTDCVKALLRSGSDPNHMNLTGHSPLNYAISPTKENEPVSMELLKLLVIDGYRTDVNQSNNMNLRLLHYCGFTGRHGLRRRPEFAKFLLSYGADPNIRNTAGLSLLESELKMPVDDFEVLKYIVRSMLQLPHLTSLRVLSPPLGLEPLEPVEPRGRVTTPPGWRWVSFPPGSGPNVNAIEAPIMDCPNEKHLWYESMAANPRTLQHHCRFTIRRILASQNNIKYIAKLSIPVALQQYLFLEKGD